MRRWLALVAIGGSLAWAGCDDLSGPGDVGRPADLGGTKPDLMVAPADMAAGCTSSPTTHQEIINACTNADRYDKQPFFPTLAPGGQLPPLP